MLCHVHGGTRKKEMGSLEKSAVLLGPLLVWL